MQTWDPAIIAAAMLTVVSGLVSGTVTIISALSASRDRREASAERLAQRHISEAASAKTDVLLESTAKIHEITNSTNSNLQKALDVMTERVAGLEKLIHQAELATALGTVPPDTQQTLTAIEKNTGDTVQELKDKKEQ